MKHTIEGFKGILDTPASEERLLAKTVDDKVPEYLIFREYQPDDSVSFKFKIRTSQGDVIRFILNTKENLSVIEEGKVMEMIVDHLSNLGLRAVC